MSSAGARKSSPYQHGNPAGPRDRRATGVHSAHAVGAVDVHRGRTHGCGVSGAIADSWWSRLRIRTRAGRRSRDDLSPRCSRGRRSTSALLVRRRRGDDWLAPMLALTGFLPSLALLGGLQARPAGRVRGRPVRRKLGAAVPLGRLLVLFFPEGHLRGGIAGSQARSRSTPCCSSRWGHFQPGRIPPVRAFAARLRDDAAHSQRRHPGDQPARRPRHARPHRGHARAALPSIGA